VEASQGQVILGLGSADLVLILRVHVFGSLHSQVSFLQKFALSLISGIQQTLQFGSMGSRGGRALSGQSLQLRLKFSLNLR
jgi:hypothetical protein